MKTPPRFPQPNPPEPGRRSACGSGRPRGPASPAPAYEAAVPRRRRALRLDPDRDQIPAPPGPPSSRPGRRDTTMASWRAPTRPQPRARRSARRWRQSAVPAPAPAHLVCVRERRARAMAVGRRPGAGAADGGGLRGSGGGGGAGLGALRSCLLLPLLGARWSLGAVARRRLPPALGSPPPAAAAAPASAPPPPAARTVARAAPPAAPPLSREGGCGERAEPRCREGLRKRGTSMERKLGWRGDAVEKGPRWRGGLNGERPWWRRDLSEGS